MKAVVACALLVGCGRVGFDATPRGDGGGGNGDGGDGGGSACVEPAATKHVPADGDFYTVVSTLAPGDVVEVSGGPYTSPGGLVHQTWNGTAAAPIVVRAAPGPRPQLLATAGNNVLDLDGQYFELRGFELSGGDIGLRFGADQHALVDDLYIHDTADQGITCNRPGESCDSVVIRRVEVAQTGNAMTGSAITFGCSDNSCKTSNSVVEGCYLHDLHGSAGDGVVIWFGDNNSVRDNVIARSNGPGIILQSSPLVTPDVVERNLIDEAQDNGIQLEGMATVRNNLIIGGTNDGISSRLEMGSNPVNVVIVHNTIDGAAAACVRGASWSGTSQVVANNALSCATTGVSLAGTPIVSANKTFVVGDVGAPPNVYPTASSTLVDVADPAHATPADFNGTPRGALPDIGAYERTSDMNPGWIPVEAMKPLPASICP